MKLKPIHYFGIVFFALCAAMLTYSIGLQTAHGFGGKSKTLPSPTVTILPIPTPTGLPTPKSYPEVTIGKISGATAKEIVMIESGRKLVNAKLAGACVKQWVLAAKYTENNGQTQAQIWETLVAHTLSVDVEMYTGSWRQNHVSKTVGWEADPFDGVVHMNRYFVNTAYMVADNLIHEHKGHSPGYHHYLNHATSQPYGMNYAFEGCSNQMMQAKGGKPYKPMGIRLEVRKVKAKPKHKEKE